MKKIISILACVCVLLSAMVIPVSAAETSVTYTFSDYKESAAVTDYSKALDDIITIGLYGTTNNGSGFFHDQLRIYQGAYATITSTNDISSFVINAGSKDGTYDISTSTDGVDWTVVVDDAAYTTAYADYTITLTTPAKYIKIEATKQMRIKTMTVNFAAESGSGGCTHAETTIVINGDETHSFVCDSCGETIRTSDCEDVDLDCACDTCAGDVALPDTLTITEAIALGEEQGTSAYTADKYLITGKITAIAATNYGNMYIADEEGNEIYIYGMYSADGSVRYDGLSEKPDEGDTVTVLSVVGNYNGTAQLKNVWLISFTEGELEPTVPDPEADSTLTIEEANALGESKKSNIYTENKYYVTGTITEVYNDQYGNMYIADENGNTLTIYGTYSADGEIRYDAMETKPVAGDTITVYGVIGNYNGTAQMKNGWITEITSADEETFEGTDPDAPIELAVDLSTLKEIKVPAGGTVFVQAADANGIFHVTSATGSYMLINGRQNQLEADGEADLTLCGYEMVNIYNPSETDTITLYVCLEAGEGEVFGTWDNPEILELMENPMMPSFPPSAQATTELEAGNQGYFYKIVATEDGAFTITVSAYDVETFEALGYQLSVTNNTTSWQSDYIARAADAEDYYDQLIVPVTVGDEILINAGTFDANDTWNAPAGAINVTVGFMANGSQNLPFVLEDTGAQETTINEGSQGTYYEWVATADGTVTVTMNDEAGWQYNVNKTPVDVDDYANYYSGDTHWYNDDPIVATETVEVVAGETVKVWVNTYDPANEYDAPAGTVNWTFDFAEKVEGAKISVSDADAVVGKTFTVTIDISNNPGIIGAKLNVNYDTEVLELVSAVAGDFANGSVNAGDEVIPNYNFSENITDYPYVINWTDPLATENTTTNGTFAVLTFKVKGTAAEGTTEISVTFDEGDIVDAQLNDVAFETVASTVTITVEDSVSGDANGDGSVNGRDYALMLQSINGWEVNIDKDAADVTGDGAVNGRDYALLLQYINGWDVTLK